MGDQTMVEMDTNYLEDTERNVNLNNISSIEELIISIVSNPRCTEWDTVGVATKQDNQLRIVKCNKTKVVEKLTVPLVGSALGEVISSKKFMVENALGKYSEFYDTRELHQQGYESLLVFPVTFRNEHCAFFIASKRTGLFSGWKSNEIKVFSSNVISLVSNVMALQEISELKSILDGFFGSSQDIVFLVDANTGKVINASKKACEIVGIEAGKLLGTQIDRIFADANHEVLLGNMLSNSGGNVIQEYLKKNGDRGTLEIRPMLIKLKNSSLIKLSCSEVTGQLLYEEIYTDVIDTMPVVLITLNADGKIVSLNSEIKVLGYAKEEILNGPISRIVCQGDYKLLDEIFQKVKSGIEKVQNVELRLVTQSGQLKFFELSGKAHYDSLGKLIKSNWILRDINEKREGLEQEQTLASVLANSSDCIYSFDKLGFIRFWNRSAERIFGYTNEEAIGKDVRILFPQERTNELDHLVKVLSENRKIEPFETVRVKKSGDRIHVHVTSTTVQDNDGQIIGYIDIVMDFSDRKAVEEAERIRKKLEEKNKRLVELNEMRSEFVSHVSHEFKTPLTSIQGYTSLLIDGEAGKLTEQQKKFAQIVVDETARLTKLINDVLDLSKIDSGKFKLAMGYFDLKELVERCSCTSLADSKDLYVKWNIAEDVPLVYGDKNKVAQVFINLISNAIKFTDAGGVTVNVRKKSRTYVEVEVVDTGRGIPPEDRDNIFKRFYQSSVISMKEGTGLGLPISREIIKLHGGMMRLAESEVGKGSKFTFILRTREKKEKLESAKDERSTGVLDSD